MKLRIGNTVLENNVILAPMAGVTDLPFRVLCREQGAGCVVTEMVSAKAVLYNNKNTRELLQIDPAERPQPCSSLARSRTLWRRLRPGWRKDPMITLT